MTDYALNIRTNHPLAESRSVRLTLIGTALFYIGVMIFLPLIVVFIEALRQGMGAYIDAITEPDAQAAIKLTLLTASIAVPLNLVFGLAASWAIAKHDFRGKHLLITFIDLPFSVSPVISGLIYVLLFGSQAALGQWLDSHNIQILFRRAGNRDCHHFRHVPVRRARNDSVDAGAGDRGRGGGDIARCHRLADVLARDIAKRQMGPAVRCSALQCPRHGRIRCGFGCVRPYQGRDEYHPPACRNSL
jgi:hypothetical protein